MKKQLKKHEARELALQVLFQREFLKEADVAESLDYFKGLSHPGETTFEYAKNLLLGVLENKERIDEIIASHSNNWKLHRMALVDLNIMRIAVYELEFSNTDTPPKVSIDEAIEIAKRYSTTESSSFINGVLDHIAKKKIS
ncbi:MAG: transcription antitermination factor NusB [Bdellovibrionales bacterium]|nr:transcription antitermination factor NusB [Bdellovibrionales bacterium]